eukprot:9470888-Pyramimonas_sp.AAC.1
MDAHHLRTGVAAPGANPVFHTVLEFPVSGRQPTNFVSLKCYDWRALGACPRRRPRQRPWQRPLWRP